MLSIDGNGFKAVEVLRDPLAWADLDSFRRGHEIMRDKKVITLQIAL